MTQNHRRQATYDLQATTASIMQDSALSVGGPAYAKQALEQRTGPPRTNVGRLAYAGYVPINEDSVVRVHSLRLSAVHRPRWHHVSAPEP